MKSVAGQKAEQIQERASKAALLGLLNLTLLPGISFVWLLIISKKADKDKIDGYHIKLAIMINIFAAFALFFVSMMMLSFGGWDSPYTWIYVITYFTFVHTLFIMAATWALAVAWSGERLAWFK